VVGSSGLYEQLVEKRGNIVVKFLIKFGWKAIRSWGFSFGEFADS
jgi:hypothetical protein